MYVYIQTEFYGKDGNNLYTVGFYKPDGKLEAESDHSTREEAAERVAYLNGGQSTQYECSMCSYKTDMKHNKEWRGMCNQCYLGETEYHISENGKTW